MKSQKSPKLDADITDYRDIPIKLVDGATASHCSGSERRVRSLVSDSLSDFSLADTRLPNLLQHYQPNQSAGKALSGSTPNLASLEDYAVTCSQNSYLSNITEDTSSNPHQILYKPCTKRPPKHHGASRHPLSSTYLKWRAGAVSDNKGVTISFI